MMDFDFGERLFGRLWQGRRRQRRRRAAAASQQLEKVAPRLEAIASMLARRPLRVREAEGVGGVLGRVLLLPAVSSDDLALGLAPEAFLRLRLAHGAFMAAALPPAPPSTLLLACLQYWRLAAAVGEQLAAQLPGLALDYARAVEASVEARPDPLSLSAQGQFLEELKLAWLVGAGPDQSAERLAQEAARLSSEGAPSPPILLWGEPLRGWQRQAAEALEAQADSLAESAVAAGASERRATAKDEIERHLLEQDNTKDATPEHVFEKIQTLEEFQGGRRRLDGEDDLADHEDALAELDLRQVVRGGPEVHSIYQAEIGGEQAVAEVSGLLPEDRAIHYPEWVAERRIYRPDWTAVYPAVAAAAVPGWGEESRRRLAPGIEKLVRRLQKERQERMRRNRQLDGPELDLPAVVEAKARWAAGQATDQRLYLSRRPRRRDQATTLLLDISLSSDGWVENRRVLDVVRDAACTLSEVADRLHDRLQILAFASNTRKLNRVWTIKDWQEDWRQVRDRLGALTPQGYTRIGPALRHAAAGLAQQSARHRLLMLLTDGKPTDFDRYEGRYGRGDVHQAVREAAREHVTVHALGFDRRAASQLGAMFGTGAWHLVRHPQELPQAVVEAYRRFA